MAGRDPDEHVRIELGGVIAFEGLAWRYPDFLMRAEAAYASLGEPTRPDEGAGAPKFNQSGAE